MVTPNSEVRLPDALMRRFLVGFAREFPKDLEHLIDRDFSLYPSEVIGQDLPLHTLVSASLRR